MIIPATIDQGSRRIYRNLNGGKVYITNTGGSVAYVSRNAPASDLTGQALSPGATIEWSGEEIHASAPTGDTSVNISTENVAISDPLTQAQLIAQYIAPNLTTVTRQFTSVSSFAASNVVPAVIGTTLQVYAISISFQRGTSSTTRIALLDTNGNSIAGIQTTTYVNGASVATNIGGVSVPTDLGIDIKAINGTADTVTIAVSYVAST